MPNLLLGPWNRNNLIESKFKQIMKLNFQPTVLKDEIEKKINLKNDS
jgi:hypothetical protein